jgi:hypothetical protein
MQTQLQGKNIKAAGDSRQTDISLLQAHLCLRFRGRCRM